MELWKEKQGEDVKIKPYVGDKTLIFKERLQNPEIKNRFIKLKEEYLSELKDGDPGLYDKDILYKEHYKKQIKDYDENIEKIFKYTNVVFPEKDYYNKNTLGKSKIGDNGTVYSDATSDGKLLDDAQKNIIEAHEKGHGLRDFTTKKERDEILESLDIEYLHEKDLKTFNYFSRKPEEIIERMSQLKNYFGFRGSEEFTLEHLKYAQENYVKDVGFDNKMQIFIDMALRWENGQKFIEVINKYPV